MTVVVGTGYSYIQRVSYNALGQVSFMLESADGSSMQTYYSYDTFSRLRSTTLSGVSQSSTYDSAGRLSSQTTAYGNTGIKQDGYTYQQYAYVDEDTGDTMYNSTSRVEKHTVVYGGKTYTYTYGYDARGNITSIAAKDVSAGTTKTTRYTYDGANQLIREDNQTAGKTWTWTYDGAGNILNKKTYNYTTGTLGTVTGTVNYGYSTADANDDGITDWGDLLTSYNGKTISSDRTGDGSLS